MAAKVSKSGPHVNKNVQIGNSPSESGAASSGRKRREPLSFQAAIIEEIKMANRIRELRQERRWSFEEVARRVGPNTSASTIKKLESGVMQLTQAWMDRLAKAFDVTRLEILEAPHVAIPATEVAAGENDVEELPAEQVEKLGLARPPHTTMTHYLVKTRTLDELGLMPGDVIAVNVNATADDLSTGDVVIAAINSPDGSQKCLKLREFIEPSLLITNARRDNRAPLNISTSAVRILGAVEAAHRSIKKFS